MEDSKKTTESNEQTNEVHEDTTPATSTEITVGDDSKTEESVEERFARFVTENRSTDYVRNNFGGAAGFAYADYLSNHNLTIELTDDEKYERARHKIFIQGTGADVKFYGYEDNLKDRVVNGTLGRKTVKRVNFQQRVELTADEAAEIVAEYGLTLDRYIEMTEAAKKAEKEQRESEVEAQFASWKEKGYTSEYVEQIRNHVIAAEYAAYLQRTAVSNSVEETTELQIDSEAEANIGEPAEKTETPNPATNDTLLEVRGAVFTNSQYTYSDMTGYLEEIAEYDAGVDQIEVCYEDDEMVDEFRDEYTPDKFVVGFEGRLLTSTFNQLKAKVASFDNPAGDNFVYSRHFTVLKYDAEPVEEEYDDEEYEPETPEPVTLPIDSDAAIATLSTLALSALAALFNVVKAPVPAEPAKPAEETPTVQPVEKAVSNTGKSKLDSTREKIAKTQDAIKKNTRRLMKLDAKVHGLGTELDFYEKAFNAALVDSAIESYSTPLDELTHIAGQIGGKLIDKAKAETTAATLRARIAKATARLEKLSSELASLESEIATAA